MSRPIRIEIEDGWYHVISRGIERRAIFRDDSDRSDFLERLFGLTESHAVLVHAYCLMQNHFHLQLQTRQANLKEAMQRLSVAMRCVSICGIDARDRSSRDAIGRSWPARKTASRKQTDISTSIRCGSKRLTSESSARRRFGVLLNGDEREQRALAAARKDGVAFEDIAASIAREFGEPWEDLKNRRGHPARSLAIVLSRRHTALTLREIGERCGGSDYAAVSHAQHQMETRLRENMSLAAIAKRIAKHLPMSYVET